MPRDHLYMTLATSSKLVISFIFGRFRGLWSTCFGFGRISMPRDPRYMTLAASSKLVITGIFGRFRGL
jgi:hypothetical protein